MHQDVTIEGIANLRSLCISTSFLLTLEHPTEWLLRKLSQVNTTAIKAVIFHLWHDFEDFECINWDLVDQILSEDRFSSVAEVTLVTLYGHDLGELREWAGASFHRCQAKGNLSLEAELWN